MKDIKLGYIIVLGFIIVLFLIFSYFLLYEPSIRTELKWGQAIQMFTGLVALGSAIIAIAISDKKNKKIKFKLETFALNQKEVERHEKSNLTEELREKFKSFPDKFDSHQVYFKITNISGFTLKGPTFTVRLSTSLMHPNSSGDNKEFRSNLFNSSQNLQRLEFANTIILSNSNLNFLNDYEPIKIWIRVCLPISEEEDIRFRISLNSDNADGNTVTIKTKRNSLLNSSENRPIIG
jgi:hypothetical protein